MSHAAEKSFDRRGVSCTNVQTVQFSGGVKKCPIYDSEDCTELTYETVTLQYGCET